MTACLSLQLSGVDQSSIFLRSNVRDLLMFLEHLASGVPHYPPTNRSKKTQFEACIMVNLSISSSECQKVF